MPSSKFWHNSNNSSFNSPNNFANDYLRNKNANYYKTNYGEFYDTKQKKNKNDILRDNNYNYNYNYNRGGYNNRGYRRSYRKNY